VFSTIISALGGAFIDKFLGTALSAFKAYNEKQISMEELKTRLHLSMIDAAKSVEVAHAQALADTYKSFMGAVVQSKFMQTIWAAVTLSQLVVLLWHQIGIPFFVMIMRQYIPGWTYPGSGSTVEWAYALLGACIGFGPMVLRTGPAGGSITDKLKAMVGR
jgi:hypothetical protein